jgi:hypothetical protein
MVEKPNCRHPAHLSRFVLCVWHAPPTARKVDGLRNRNGF